MGTQLHRPPNQERLGAMTKSTAVSRNLEYIPTVDALRCEDLDACNIADLEMSSHFILAAINSSVYSITILGVPEFVMRIPQPRPYTILNSYEDRVEHSD
ncbi:hypothetical protein J7T55_003911 [Diaporthe amygdali]|uniref:uncharacterized protein n=1 Tax=Phomopsis amygdali TaxID=1214568 RepID=UPI0022FE15AD|nr:uncharacterized protein J7T55_003911 [Diaporthe amygdali]KAJ0117494.1 hypothetical protein J7T55_003911 [Diaporthe amygdali]